MYLRRGQFPEDIFTLRSIFFQGRRPKSVNMYWRRFAVSEIPINDPKAFDEWLLERWREKDRLLEGYLQTGRFPANDGEDEAPNGTIFKKAECEGYIETEIRTKSPFEFLRIYVPMTALYLIIRLISQFWYLLLVTIGIRSK
jgi:lysocardiolipin and lysophospholipid acyltransferase